MSETQNIINGVSLREAMVEALKRLGAWRDDEIFMRDTLKLAKRTVAVSEEIAKGGYPISVKDIALGLTDLAQKDASMRPFASYVGGCWPKTWDAHEWSLPPQK